MINIDELRRGNFILHKDSFNNDMWVLVTSISLANAVWFISHVPDRLCYPIPITKDNIAKIGFEEVGMYENVCHKDDCRIHLNNGSGLLQYERGDFYVEIEVHSIHQLQNVYFALTGKELKLHIKSLPSKMV